MSMSKSPDRNTFQKQRYLERMAQQGRTPDNDDAVRAMVEYYESWDKDALQREHSLDWQKNNLEYDLRTSDKMVAKVRGSELYSQHLYAAMCNQEFQKIDVWPILKGETWGCTWRYAGGIIADMLGQGDYIDWYCSGMKGIGVYAPCQEGEELTKEQQAKLDMINQYVGEGHVTDEIRADLLELGWTVVESDD
jgi:hypothetical protein